MKIGNAEPSKGKSTKILLIVILITIIVFIGVEAAILISVSSKKSKENAQKEPLKRLPTSFASEDTQPQQTQETVMPQTQPQPQQPQYDDAYGYDGYDPAADYAYQEQQPTTAEPAAPAVIPPVYDDADKKPEETQPVTADPESQQTEEKKEKTEQSTEQSDESKKKKTEESTQQEETPSVNEALVEKTNFSYAPNGKSTHHTVTVDTNNIKGYDGDGYAEEYEIFDYDYSGDYYVENIQPKTSDYKMPSGFNQISLVGYKTYAKFCKTYNVTQKYTDESKGYIIISSYSPSSAANTINLADLTTSGNKATIWIYQNTSGSGNSNGNGYVMTIPVASNINNCDYIELQGSKDSDATDDFKKKYGVDATQKTAQNNSQATTSTDKSKTSTTDKTTDKNGVTVIDASKVLNNK